MPNSSAVNRMDATGQRLDYLAGKTRPLSTRHRTILSMEMRSANKRDIAQALGMSETYISLVTRSQRYIKAREEILGQSDIDFINLKPLAVNTLRDAMLPSANMPDRLKAADLWFRTRGYGAYAKQPEGAGNVTAEDVVKRLLQVNVQVNINKDQDQVTPLLDAAE